MDRKKLGLTAAVEGPRAAWMASAALLMGLAACMFYSPARAAETPHSFEAQLAAARAASKDLGETLKAQLVAAIKAGGPQSAVGVCRTIAPAIATQASQSHGIEVGRTALRVRNPANVPDDFERQALEDFVQKIAAGADPAKLEHAEIVSENGETTFRYMKAIPTAADPCLACHGSNIDPGLKAEILRLYPDDRATGFKAGELRGAFTVKQKMR